MVTRSHPSRQTEVVSWTILFALSLAWLLFLLIQRGQIFDEAEHGHVAWLISQGKRPIDDFFQHHLPLLWSLLALYFRAGFIGAGVLIWGRVLVVLSGTVSLGALWLLGRSPSSSNRLMAYLGAAFFIGLTGFVPELFVIRPETIAAACFLLGLLLWYRSDGWAVLIAAGASTGIAMYATPRFVLLGALFFLFGHSTVRRWALLAAGAVLFLVIYTKLSGFSVDKVLFSLRFSSHLQSVGDSTAGRHETTWLALLFITCLPLAAMVPLVHKADRRRAALLVGYAALVFLGCNYVAGLFRYAQAYAPFFVAVSIAAAWIGGRAQWPTQQVPAMVPLVVAMLLLPGVAEFRPSRPHFDFFASVKARNRLAAMVPRGGTVLVYTRDNPISIEDASYYGIPLDDGKDRLCRAVNSFRSKIKLPKCDLLETLQSKRPYLVDATIKNATDNPAEASEIIARNYQVVDLGPTYPDYMQTEVESFKSPLAGK